MFYKKLTDHNSHETAKQFSEELVVRVWDNINKKLGLVTVGATRSGHSAMSLRGMHSKSVYISWWPAEAVDPTGKDVWKKMGGKVQPNYFKDKLMEMHEPTAIELERRHLFARDYKKIIKVEPTDGPGFAPRDNQARYVVRGETFVRPMWATRADRKVYLPGLRNGRPGAAFGMGTTQIKKWWIEWQASGGADGSAPLYCMASKCNNCSGVILTGLLVGGAAAYTKPPTVSIATEPNQVAAYATELETAIRETNRQLGVLLHMPRPRNVRMGGLMPGMGMWKVRDWKKASSVPLEMRGRTVRAIDSAVAAFHGCSWQSDFGKRLKALVTIVRNAETFVRKYPQHGRTPAMLMLASQVNDELANRVPIAT